ncbi:hypothetical protein HDG34_000002 [Paraburkholderia sp. HC6.4b]|uniref:hypothetical protein n=1 Tax=unclassified Paraburkholderia TaxID=2615204 RepID=UPI00162083DD|nr:MULTISPECIES: hypothetical protein [unclassified Paraburkholderia]MBB5406087.1 hypothetical protein [Paraburkholderia sp. HC6.4b]MBB5448483.1 hypothetical protein [Paraburkholderia sp. Kb1A]
MNLKADIKKPASFGGLCVTASRRALTHHSMNDANNQRNTDVEAVHVGDLRRLGKLCQSPRSAAVPHKKNGAHRQARPAETTNTDINGARRSAF